MRQAAEHDHSEGTMQQRKRVGVQTILKPVRLCQHILSAFTHFSGRDQKHASEYEGTSGNMKAYTHAQTTTWTKGRPMPGQMTPAWIASAFVKMWAHILMLLMKPLAVSKNMRQQLHQARKTCMRPQTCRLYYTRLYCTILYFSMLYYTVYLSNTILCYTMLYYAIL